MPEPTDSRTRGPSPRLRAVVDALPLRPGMRVIEVGGAPGAAAREVADRVRPNGHVLVLDRSPKGVALTKERCATHITAGLLSVRLTAVEDAALLDGEAPYDLAFACRVGVLDGRHPAREADALTALRRMLTPTGRIFVDTGDPLREVPARLTSGDDALS
jgi:ubiquinone/menaquinone biosynthesis C-methylase UbiE